MKSRYSIIGKEGARIRWASVHSKIKISKDLTKNKISINAYLCGDGYIAIRKNKKDVHHELTFSFDNQYLSKRIVLLFKREYGVEPKIYFNGGCFRIRLKNKPICKDLLSIGKYGHLKWRMPKLNNKIFLKEWIKCFFDCEAHVNIKNKQIQVKSVCRNGLYQVQESLEFLGIKCKIYGPYSQKRKEHNPYSLLVILGKDSMLLYEKIIGFYHPEKKEKLLRIIKAFIKTDKSDIN